jgi:fatty acid synthase subunit alpha
VKDQPIKDLSSAVSIPLSSSGCEAKILTIDYTSENLFIMPEDALASFDVERTDGGAEATHELSPSLQETLTWLEATIIKGTPYINNPIFRLFALHTGQQVVVGLDSSAISSVTLYRAAAFVVLEIKPDASTKRIDITIFEDRHNVSVASESLQSRFQCIWRCSHHEIAQGNNTRVKES